MAKVMVADADWRRRADWMRQVDAVAAQLGGVYLSEGYQRRTYSLPKGRLVLKVDRYYFDEPRSAPR